MEKGGEWIDGVMPRPGNDKSVCREPGGERESRKTCGKATILYG
jgi:hypothetical protein